MCFLVSYELAGHGAMRPVGSNSFSCLTQTVMSMTALQLGGQRFSLQCCGLEFGEFGEDRQSFRHKSGKFARRANRAVRQVAYKDGKTRPHDHTLPCLRSIQMIWYINSSMLRYTSGCHSVDFYRSSNRQQPAQEAQLALPAVTFAFGASSIL